MIDLSALRDQWIEIRPKYAALATYVETTLRDQTRERGILSLVDSREKDVASFLKKAIKKGYDEPLEHMTDKAGARVVVTHQEQITTVCDIVEQMFCVHEREDKAADLGTDRLGYLGIHYLVSPHHDHLSEDQEAIKDLICEVQVNTQAQRVWADLAHDLTYKSAQEISGPADRQINRLIALIEIFDDEATRAKEMIEGQEGYREAQLLTKLETEYYRLAGKRYDRELSVIIVGHLLPTLDEGVLDGYGPIIEGFVASNRNKLEQIFGEYESDDRRSPLLYQPESLLIFERMMADSYVLKHHWTQHLPLAWLEELAAVWGNRV